VKALANEVAKNLVLAGIGSLTIIDHQVVTEEDLGAQFFIAQAQSEQNVIGKNVSYSQRRIPTAIR
jgi:ubiquitin-like 1-activating enzyme E1 A